MNGPMNSAAWFSTTLRSRRDSESLARVLERRMAARRSTGSATSVQSFITVIVNAFVLASSSPTRMLTGVPATRLRSGSASRSSR